MKMLINLLLIMVFFASKPAVAMQGISLPNISEIEEIRFGLPNTSHTWSIIKPFDNAPLDISFDHVFEGSYNTVERTWKLKGIQTIFKLKNAFDTAYLYLYLITTAIDMPLPETAFDEKNKTIILKTNLKEELLKSALKKCEELYNYHKTQIPYLIDNLKDVRDSIFYKKDQSQLKDLTKEIDNYYIVKNLKSKGKKLKFFATCLIGVLGVIGVDQAYKKII
ncbi:MAG: hypothetical protein V1855_02255, partial [bacterium]